MSRYITGDWDHIFSLMKNPGESKLSRGAPILLGQHLKSCIQNFILLQVLPSIPRMFRLRRGRWVIRPHNITLTTSCMEDDYGGVNFILPINFLMGHSLQLPCHQRSHGQVGCMELFQYQVPWMQGRLFMRRHRYMILKFNEPKTKTKL